MYACATTRVDEEKNIIERKVLRKMYGPYSKMGNKN